MNTDGMKRSARIYLKELERSEDDPKELAEAERKVLSSAMLFAQEEQIEKMKKKR